MCKCICRGEWEPLETTSRISLGYVRIYVGFSKLQVIT